MKAFTKQLIALCFTALAVGELNAQDKIQWMSFEGALQKNAVLASINEKPKMLFVDVYTDWCGWCKRMDATTFSDPEIVKYMNEHFIAVKMNAERKDTVVINGQTYVNKNPGNSRSTHELAQILLQGKMSFPSFTIIDETGKQLQVLAGFQQAPQFEKILNFFGSGAYKTTGWDDFEKTFVGKVK